MAAIASASSSSSLCTMPAQASSSSSLSPHSAQDIVPPSPLQKPTFALARIKGDVCLVQVPHTSSSALMVADVHVFRHEFITQFRYSHRATLHPADVHILEPIEEHCTLYEEDKGTVFLARDVMTRLQRLTIEARRQSPPHRYHHRPRHSMHAIPVHLSSARMSS